MAEPNDVLQGAPPDTGLLFQLLELLGSNILNQGNRIGGHDVPVFDPNLERKDVFETAGYDEGVATVLALASGLAEPGPGELKMAADLAPAFGMLTPMLRRTLGQTTRVVDETGMAKPVFHGTNRAFDRFDPQFVREGHLGPGFYFSETPDIPNERAMRGTMGRSPDLNARANVRTHYLGGVENPVDLGTPQHREMYQTLLREHGDDKARVAEILQDRGFDALIDPDTSGARHYVVWDERKIFGADRADEISRMGR